MLGKSAAEQFHEHLGLVDVAHAHAFGDGLAQALVGGGGGRGHGRMLAGAGQPSQVWVWAARQAIAPAGISSGVGVQRLQPTRLRALVRRPIDQERLSFCLYV